MNNPLSLDDRAILVTGASSGIGRETALLLGKLGARVILVARNQERLQHTMNDMHGQGHIIVPADLNEIPDTNRWLVEIVEKVGPLSGLVHCAGVHRLVPVRFITEHALDELMKTNVYSALSLARSIRQKGAYVPSQTSIVFISSVMAVVGQPGAAIYSGTKGALLAAGRSLALELAPQGIRVNCVLPGQVDTPMTARQQEMLGEKNFAQIEQMHPLGIGTALDVAYACAFLLGEMGRWITGTGLVVDGGYTAQ